ncbi:uncharacterized protein LOC133910985 [Phragmites australis]|uniref:uncharacterized protein LOC133910985 n=1 Tax=Phragmites australis TaxID=29695 RepID=UPI002D776DED|nr:uncharacterized protein LOC133910985 [Phragmites australis]
MEPQDEEDDVLDDLEEIEDFDPTGVFIVEDFLAEDEIIEEFIRELGDEMKADIDRRSSTVPNRRRRQIGPRRYIPRNREKGHDDLVANYFSANPIYTDEMFRRRFRMTRPLFLRIVDNLREWSPYFTQRVDATGRDSLSPLQKCTAAIRMLAYGSSADQLDEVLKIAASTCLEILGKFAEGVIECFGEEYLRPPTSDEMEKILQENEARGFPGMLGSIDCMHWAWKNCPKGWAGMFTRGDKGVPTMILEAVASHDLRIWHAFFGTPGSQNDINVLNKSPLFIQAIKGEAPTVQYIVNGTQYDMGYYLADKIYPEWAVFVKTVTAPQSAEDKLFALMQEGARKDVECAFGVLQSRFDIVRRPAKLWKQADVINIMQACVILHNMIVEDEKESVRVALDLNENPSATIVLPPEVRTSDNPNPCFAEVLRRNSAIKARPTHRKLKKDLIEHIWHRYRNKED